LPNCRPAPSASDSGQRRGRDVQTIVLQPHDALVPDKPLHLTTRELHRQPSDFFLGDRLCGFAGIETRYIRIAQARDAVGVDRKPPASNRRTSSGQPACHIASTRRVMRSTKAGRAMSMPRRTASKRDTGSGNSARYVSPLISMTSSARTTRRLLPCGINDAAVGSSAAN